MVIFCFTTAACSRSMRNLPQCTGKARYISRWSSRKMWKTPVPDSKETTEWMGGLKNRREPPGWSPQVQTGRDQLRRAVILADESFSTENEFIEKGFQNDLALSSCSRNGCMVHPYPRRISDQRFPGKTNSMNMNFSVFAKRTSFRRGNSVKRSGFQSEKFPSWGKEMKESLYDE